jgi:hypothetical protein
MKIGNTHYANLNAFYVAVATFEASDRAQRRAQIAAENSAKYAELEALAMRHILCRNAAIAVSIFAVVFFAASAALFSAI